MGRLFRRAPAPVRAENAGEAPVEALVARGLGEPSTPGSADDAELDSLRGELVRELDRMAADGHTGSDAFRRT
jgi:hypothetical protein